MKVTGWAAAPIAVLVAGAFAATAALADETAIPADEMSVEEFYNNNHLTILVGYGPGGGYDVYARMIAAHIGKYIPGEPDVIVQNMPGAGSLRATNHLFNLAPRDGSMIGTFARNIPLNELYDENPNLEYRSTEFTWIGSPSSFGNDAYLMIVRKDSGFETIQDVMDHDREPLVVGGTAEGGGSNDVVRLLEEALDLNIRLILGYPDSGDIFIALQRNEVSARTVGYSALAGNHPAWLEEDSDYRFLLQFARTTRHDAFPDVPTTRELVTELGDEDAMALIALAEAPFQFSRPYAGPPGIPQDRADALREAFMAVHEDEEFLAMAASAGIDISPIDGDAILEIIEEIFQTPDHVIQRMIEVLAQDG